MSKLYGVHDELFIRNDDRVQELNERMFNRNTSVRPVTSQLDIRSTPTRYVTMPIVNMRPIANVQCPQVIPFNVHGQFFPGNTKSPIEGFNVDRETILRNQAFALQNCEQSVYVPSSNSDLYAKTVPQQLYTGRYRNMFTKPDIQPRDRNPENLGSYFFNNSTREQRIEYGEESQKMRKNNNN